MKPVRVPQRLDSGSLSLAVGRSGLAPLQTSQMRWPNSLPALTPSLTLRRQNRQWCRLENIPNGCLVMKQFGAISHPSARCSESSLNLQVQQQQGTIGQRGTVSPPMDKAMDKMMHGCAALTCRGCPKETDRFCCAWSGQLQHEAVVKSRQPASFRWQGEADYHLRGHDMHPIQSHQRNFPGISRIVSVV